MDKAVLDGRIKCFNMRESDADGDQDLNLWARELEGVVREIMEDPVKIPVFKGNQNFKFEMDLDEAGKWLFGGEAKAGVAFQIGRLRCVIYSNTYILCIYVYIHGIYVYIYMVYTYIYMVYTCTYVHNH